MAGRNWEARQREGGRPLQPEVPGGSGGGKVCIWGSHEHLLGASFPSFPVSKAWKFPQNSSTQQLTLLSLSLRKPELQLFQQLGLLCL